MYKSLTEEAVQLGLTEPMLEKYIVGVVMTEDKSEMAPLLID